MSVVTYIGLFSIINLVIFILILITKKTGIKQANFLLALFLLDIAIVQFVFISWHSGWYRQIPWVIHIDYVVLSLFGFSFYCYIRAMTLEKVIITKKWLIHFIPFVFILTYYIYFQSHSKAYKIEYVVKAYEKFPLIEYILNILVPLSVIFYFVLSYRKIQAYKKKIKACFSDIHQINLKWIQTLLISFALLFIVIAGSLNILPVHIKEELNELVGIPVLAAFYILFFVKTIHHPFFFHGQICLSDIREEDITIEKDQEEKDWVNYFSQIDQYVQLHKLFLQPRLTIKDISNAMDIPIHSISKSINAGTGNNFFSYINQYRIEEAQRCLVSDDYSNFTIESIGKACGFNSSASFYDVFRKATGTTPNKYKQLYYKKDHV